MAIVSGPWWRRRWIAGMIVYAVFARPIRLNHKDAMARLEFHAVKHFSTLEFHD